MSPDITELLQTVFWLAVTVAGVLMMMVVMSRANGSDPGDADEPMGDMVDVRALMKRWEDD